MAYTKQTWNDLPNTTTPITAEKLNHIEDGIYDAHNLQRSAIMVCLNENKTISTTAWVINDIPFNKVQYNYGGKFSLNTSTGVVTYTGNKPIKVIVHIKREDNTTSGSLYPCSSFLGWVQEFATANVINAQSVNFGSATEISGRFMSGSTGNSVLGGHANNIYTYMIVEEI